MCGILGVVGNIADLPPAVFDFSLLTIAHRGPDARGIWNDDWVRLGHQRLSILDLTSDSDQPFVDPGSGLVMVFNGEIFNYVELRAELQSRGHRFRTQGDTEVLLRGYVEWGSAVLDRCNGMWALAIWNPIQRTLFLARDRFGKKPLYYSLQKDRLIFGSEPKALHSLDVRTVEPNWSAVVGLMVDSRLHDGARTFYRSIAALPPAHCGIYDATTGQMKSWRYWSFPSRALAAGADEDRSFSGIFEDSVRIRLRSDVPVGLTLSGGLDSTAVLAAASACTQERAVRNYTAVFGEKLRGEESWARGAAELAGSTVTSVEADLTDWWQTLTKIVWHLDAPAYSPAIIPQWSIMKRLREDGIKVVLEGQGADELLGGYAPYAAIDTVESLRSLKLRQFISSASGMSQAFTPKWTAAWVGRTLLPRLAIRLTRYRRRSLFHSDLIKGWVQAGAAENDAAVDLSYDPLRAALWRDHTKDVLPGLLHYGDAISMAHGVEARLPFMDYRLVEWVFRSHPALIRAGITKLPVRDYLQDRGYGAIAGRKDKLGYPVPILAWYHSVGRDRMRSMLVDSQRNLWSIFNRTEAGQLGDAAARGSYIAMTHLFKILTIDIWLEHLALRRTARVVV